MRSHGPLLRIVLAAGVLAQPACLCNPPGMSSARAALHGSGEPRAQPSTCEEHRGGRVLALEPHASHAPGVVGQWPLRPSLEVRLRGGGKPKAKVGGKPLPGRGYISRVGRRSSQDPIAQLEKQMAATASRHRKQSKKKPAEHEGWFRKFVRQRQGLIDAKKGERAAPRDTRQRLSRPSAVERFAYRQIYNIEPQPRPIKASVLERLHLERCRNASLDAPNSTTGGEGKCAINHTHSHAVTRPVGQ